MKEICFLCNKNSSFVVIKSPKINFMKKNLLLLITFITIGLTLQAQREKWYYSSAGEIIFSSATINHNGTEGGSVVRFSPVFNSQNHLNKDLSENFGIFTGLNLRNVGFIRKHEGTDIRTKHRNYNIGVPVGIKLGAMNKSFLYAGYEIEFPINYKEKTFENEKRTDRFNVWFSKRVPTFYHTVMAGIQFKGGANLKFKYYLTNFFNKDFTETVGGVQVKPYANTDVHVFYVSLSFDMLRSLEQIGVVEVTETRVY